MSTDESGPKNQSEDKMLVQIPMDGPEFCPAGSTPGLYYDSPGVPCNIEVAKFKELIKKAPLCPSGVEVSAVFGEYAGVVDGKSICRGESGNLPSQRQREGEAPLGKDGRSGSR